MALNIWTGFHWCSPVNTNNSAMARELLQKMERWGAVVLMYSYPGHPGNPNPDFVNACERVMDAREAAGGGRSLDQTIARLWFGGPLTLNDIGSVSAADTWLREHGYYDSLNYFVNNGGRNCVIFNELNLVGSEPQAGIDPRIMGYLGYALVDAYYNAGNRLLYVLFPGPSGLQGQSPFLSYFTGDYFANNTTGYDLWDNGVQAKTFGQWAADHGVSVDPTIANRTMLYHSGTGVFDRIALHCYAYTKAQFQDPVIGNNPALQYIQWFQQVDSSEWIYVTEASGSEAYDDYYEGVALAWFEQNVSDLNAQPIPLGFGGQVQAVYGYILDISNAGASRNAIDRFSCHATDGYDYQRGQLGF